MKIFELLHMELIRKNWWVLALQGLLLIALGLFVLFSTGFHLSDLLIYLGIILLSFGLVMSLVGLRKRKTHSNWWGLAFFGLLQIIIGAYILTNPYRAASVFAYAIGGWAMLIGVAQFIMGFGRSKAKLLYFLSGAVSLVVGFLIIYNPFSAVNSLTYLVGFYSLLLGCFIVFYSFKARKLGLALADGEKVKTIKEKPSTSQLDN